MGSTAQAHMAHGMAPATAKAVSLAAEAVEAQGKGSVSPHPTSSTRRRRRWGAWSAGRIVAEAAAGSLPPNTCRAVRAASAIPSMPTCMPGLKEVKML